MKLLFEEGVPRQLVSRISGHEIQTVKLQGWLGVKNGRLLDLIERASFEVFLTNDKRMKTNSACGAAFTVLILSTNHWTTMEPHIPTIVLDLDRCELGEVSSVNCGTFLPRKFRNG